MAKNKAKKQAIWLFAGGTMQEPAALDILGRGYKLILTDAKKDCFCSKYADELVHLDTFDIPGNVARAKVLKKKYSIKAVLTAGADCHETVAYVAQALRLPGIDPRISHICRYKYLTREVLTKAGIPQPKFQKVYSYSEAQQAIKHIGLPAALKATNNSGSRGFSQIGKLADLSEEVFKRAQENGTTGAVIIEELMIPVEDEIAEQSAETLWSDGKMYWLNWVDRLFRKDLKLFPSFKKLQKKDFAWGVELAHINPALHDISVKEEVKDMIEKAGRALGMHKQKGCHILKADIMLTTKGSRIIELTPRLSGGWDSSMTTPERGADFIGGVITLTLGEKLTLDVWQKYFEYKNPSLYASVFARIPKNALDSIGRDFAASSDFNRDSSLWKAYQNILKNDLLPRKQKSTIK
jgi:biotin carboxylase